MRQIILLIVSLPLFGCNCKQHNVLVEKTISSYFSVQTDERNRFDSMRIINGYTDGISPGIYYHIDVSSISIYKNVYDNTEYKSHFIIDFVFNREINECFGIQNINTLSFNLFRNDSSIAEVGVLQEKVT